MCTKCNSVADMRARSHAHLETYLTRPGFFGYVYIYIHIYIYIYIYIHIHIYIYIFILLERCHGGTRWAHGYGAQVTQVWVIDTRRGGGTPG